MRTKKKERVYKKPCDVCGLGGKENPLIRREMYRIMTTVYFVDRRETRHQSHYLWLCDVCHRDLLLNSMSIHAIDGTRTKKGE